MKSRWISYWPPNPRARLRLFCLPYAGGSASVFRNWPKYLPETIELGLVHLPGRMPRRGEQALTRLTPLVQRLTTALYSELDRPFAIFGHSMGATVGFELVRELRRRGGPMPSHLFVSARSAPQIVQDMEVSCEVSDHTLIEFLKRLNGTPACLFERPKLLKSFLPIFRADFELLQTYGYSPEPPLNCPITAFGGSRDREVAIEELKAWRMQTTVKFSFRLFDGDHFFLHPSEPLLLKSILRQMDHFQKDVAAARL